MRLIYTHPACPTDIVEHAASASCSSDLFESVRPLSFHSECLVSLAKPRTGDASRLYAVKSYVKSSIAVREQVDTEAEIHSSLAMLQHVVPLLLVAEDSRHLLLVTAWADGGDLRGLPKMSEGQLREQVVIPMLGALCALERQGIVHRDIKPDNILVHAGSVMLADFGLAVYVETSAQQSISKPSALKEEGAQVPPCQEEEVYSSMFERSASTASHLQCTASSASRDSSWGALHESLAINISGNSHVNNQSCSDFEVEEDCNTEMSLGAPGSRPRAPSSPALLGTGGGTPLYTAPEVLLAMFESRAVQETICHKNDVWSMALMALEKLVGHHPFKASSTCPGGNLLYSIAHHKKVHLPSSLSPLCADFMATALHRDPQQRPSAYQLLKHPWLNSLTADGALHVTTSAPSMTKSFGVVGEPSSLLSCRVSTWQCMGEGLESPSMQQHRVAGASSGGGARGVGQVESWEY